MSSAPLSPSGMDTANSGRGAVVERTVLVDGHVHLHPNYDLAHVLDCALTNLSGSARKANLEGELVGCLLLTESAGINRFDELAGMAGRQLGHWTLRREPWEAALVAECPDRLPLVLVAGRQVVTSEGLEVLAIGCRQHFGEGEPLSAVVALSADKARLSIVPWGFGKWTGNRGTLVRELIESPVAANLYLGDNGGRLQNAARPALFDVAALRNIPVLPGTDPFPFRSHAKRVGSYGFLLRGPVRLDNLGLSVMELIAEDRTQPAEFGCRSGAVEFLTNQVAMQVRKRLFKR